MRIQDLKDKQDLPKWQLEVRWGILQYWNYTRPFGVGNWTKNTYLVREIQSLMWNLNKHRWRKNSNLITLAAILRKSLQQISQLAFYPCLLHAPYRQFWQVNRFRLLFLIPEGPLTQQCMLYRHGHGEYGYSKISGHTGQLHLDDDQKTLLKRLTI